MGFIDYYVIDVQDFQIGIEESGGESFRGDVKEFEVAVGSRARTSRPSSAAEIISCCEGLKLSYPQYSFSVSSAVILRKDTNLW